MYTPITKNSSQYREARRLTDLGFKFIGRQVQQNCTYVQNKYRLNITECAYLLVTADYSFDTPISYTATIVELNYAPVRKKNVAFSKTLDQLIDDIIYVASR